MSVAATGEGEARDRRASPGPPPELRREALDGERLLALALRERAVSVLWNDLTAEERSGLAREPANSFRALAAVEEFRMREMTSRLEDAVTVLGDGDIDVLLLKGCALVRDAGGYREVRQRPMFDLDLLVEGGRAREARDLLVAGGWRWREDEFPESMYREHCHLPPLEHAGGPGTVLELHTGLFPDGHPFAFGVEDLTTGSRAVDVGGHEARVPEPVAHLVYICLHFAWSHTLTRAAWRTFRDVAVLSRDERFDWDRVLALARRSRGGSCCYWTLRLARELGGIHVPTAVLEELRPEVSDRVAGWLLRHLALQLMEREKACPSLQMQRWLWELAVRPGRAGHGRSRPWSDGGGRIRFGEEVPATVWQRLAWHASRTRTWGAYLIRVLG